MTRRRILWVSQLIPYPPSSGVLLRAYNLMKAVAARHDVTLVAFIQNIWLDTCFPSRAEGLRESRRVLEGMCAHVEFLPIDNLERPGGRLRTALAGVLGSSGYIERWLQSPRAHGAFQRLAREEKFDLAHFDTISLAPFRRHFPNVLATLGHHNVESHMLLRRAENSANPIKKLYFWQEGRRVQRYERKVGPEFLLHITCSDVDGERLRELNITHATSTIANGVNCEFFASAGATPRPNSLIFVGTMNWYPNVDAVLFLLQRLWKPLKERQPALTLDIVGAHPPPSIVEAARALPGVTVHGFLPDVRPLLDSATLFVCPIRDGGGTKLKILDAFAMGKCVVAHPIACEGIDVTPGANVEFAVEPDEWVAKITTLLGDPVMRAARADAARRLVVERYSFDAIGAKLAQEFDQLIARGASPSTSR